MNIRLSVETERVLIALTEGSFLKSHRYINGTKIFRLHPLEGDPVEVQRQTIDSLVQGSLVTSNQKFPAATYMITDKGRALATALINKSLD
jgi:predicted transcriptional regulator